LEYTVSGASVQERLTTRKEGEHVTVGRSFKFDRVPQTLLLVLGKRQPVVGDLYYIFVTDADGKGTEAAKVVSQQDGMHVVRLQPSSKPVGFQVFMSLTGSAQTWATRFAPAAKPPTTRWPQITATFANAAKSTNAYVLDDIPIPDKNPWRRNVRFADLAFFPDGRAAFVTFDGDVWLASGLSGDLKAVQWKRFTSGLHEPMGIAIRKGEIFVNDRNGLWRLKDTDNNGETDVHELFCNLFAQTAETREFAAGLKLAPDGSFVIAKGGQQGSTIGKYNGTVLRIAPDGKSFETIGYGFREPFIGMHPKTGLVTVSDQQGNYVPATPLYALKGNEFHGFLTHLLPKEKYPAPIADPLTWIPHPVNSSAVGQVWLADAKMGSLTDALIHLGYNRPELFLVRMNERGTKPQAAVIGLFRDFSYAPINGAVNPLDGQLYVTGMQIWGSTATNISGITRVRYTGAPSNVPREIVPMDKGILLRFDVPVEAQQATNLASFSIERWNYKRTPAYGSPHFKLDGSKGTDTIVPSSAYLSKDGKTVFIGLPDMKPVMQMRVGWGLTMKGGAPFANNAYFTPYELVPFNPTAEGFEPLTVDLTPRTMAAAEATPITVAEGARVAELMGCVACHSTDGSTLGKVGPTWQGIFGSQREIAGKGKVLADEAYLRESIKEPTAKMVKGFEKSDAGMPSYEGVISDAQIEALVLYLKTLK
jgi:cytochrome c2